MKTKFTLSLFIFLFSFHTIKPEPKTVVHTLVQKSAELWHQLQDANIDDSSSFDVIGKVAYVSFVSRALPSIHQEDQQYLCNVYDLIKQEQIKIAEPLRDCYLFYVQRIQKNLIKTPFCSTTSEYP